jgi:serine/threonine protein kinase
MADPPDLDALAQAVADGEPVDWETLEATERDPARRALVRHLRVLSQIGSHHRHDPAELPAVTRWTHLEVRERIGGGAYGDVYRAWDPELEREVALKLVRLQPPHAPGAGLREARRLARIRHPHVVTIHGAAEANGYAGLWMELVHGRTLRQVVEDHGPYGAHEAIITGLALCRALCAVHAAGVLHGDIKAQNVMRERGGRIVLMDLGAARLLADTEAAQRAGTPLYLAPEVLAEGRADARSDVYSAGVVLFFVLTGTFPFLGSDARSIAAAQAAGRARSIRELRGDLPEVLLAVVERALATDPDARYSTAAEMERALSACLGGRDVASAGRASLARWRTLPLAAAAVLVAAGVGWIAATWSAPPPEAPVRLRSTLALTPPPVPWYSSVAVSQRGSWLAYISSDSRIFVRSLESSETREVPGSQFGLQPFFSPDEQWLGYFAGGMLKKYSLVDGTVTAIAPAANPRGGTWTDDGWIVYAPGPYEPLWRVRPGGGTPEQLTALEHTAGNRWPAALPGGRVAATLWPVDENLLHSRIGVFDPASGQWQVIGHGTTPRYAPGGFLLFAREADVLALRWNADRGVPEGPVVPVQTEVLTYEHDGFAHYDVSRHGLVYLQGRMESEMRRLVWVDRQGRVEPLALTPRNLERPRISPDGRRALFVIRERQRDVWQLDLARGVPMRITDGSESEHESPVWSPDGSRIAYAQWTFGRPRVIVTRVPGDVDAPPEVVRSVDTHEHVSDWSPRCGLLLTTFDDRGFGSILVLRPGAETATPFIATPANERDARISPDGEWLLYTSDETGRDEVYVRERTGPRRLQVSSDGGSEGVWQKDGKGIFYRSPTMMMAVRWPIAAGAESEPRPLFKDTFFRTGRREVGYDVTPDGSRFLMVESLPETLRPLQIVLGWAAETEGRMAAARKLGR